MLVTVLGLGYVGLALCKAFVDAGYSVTGIDTDASRVKKLGAGTSPVSDIEDSQIIEMQEKGFEALANYPALLVADTLVVAVPTPIGGDNLPDLTQLTSAVSSIESRMNERPLIVIESTVAPGTTAGLVRDTLEANGKCAGKDFLLAFSPERINPGSSPQQLKETPKIIAGLDQESLSFGASVYENAGFSVVPAASLEAAEAAKLLENTYRAVNLSLISELADGFAELGLDTTEVIRLASTKPFGFEPFHPGIGVGGHCIPVDPWYLLSAIEEKKHESKLLRSALENNIQAPLRAAQKLHKLLQGSLPTPDTPSILILGMTYKADVGDFRNAPGPQLASHLVSLGYQVGYHDPFLERHPPRDWEGEWEEDLELAQQKYMVKVIAQNHSQYLDNELVITAGRTYWAAPSPQKRLPSIWGP